MRFVSRAFDMRFIFGTQIAALCATEDATIFAAKNIRSALESVQCVECITRKCDKLFGAECAGVYARLESKRSSPKKVIKKVRLISRNKDEATA